MKVIFAVILNKLVSSWFLEDIWSQFPSSSQMCPIRETTGVVQQINEEHVSPIFENQKALYLVL